MQSARSEHMNHQAREWFVTLQSGSVSAAQRQAFERWYAVAEHAQAFREYELVWQSLGAMQGGAELAALRQSVAPKPWAANWFGWPQFGFSAAVAAALLVGLVFILNSQPAIDVQEYSTAVAGQKTVVLADGSAITLGAKTHVKVWQSAKERHVDLVQGLAFFDVAKDRARPFNVAAAGVHIKVVGTQFDVSNQGPVVRVAVREGQVNVEQIKRVQQSVTASAARFELKPGQAVERVGNGELQAIAPGSAQAAGDWRNGQLLYRNARLADVVADANRYFEGEIVLGSLALQSTRVTLALRTDQVDVFPELLSRTLPVEIHRDTDNRTVILSAQDK
ncbi:FecR domain-containing protein [Simiduia curdlanivorans]|uniref:FecR family protein n=1 Tax=Simiduia curdlanivorans TaxID=1492769 RepID=A0ABV8V5B6_9GAMM|nr:FecR domain-containing protein [Simiduia curdlanivorans]MDN3640726.1 FecR domain-containing protein [Simiduia curdlanivorans]